MAQDLIRWMHALFLPGATCGDEPWAPAADVYRTQRGWLVKFDLAGVRPSEIELSAAENFLTISGVRRDRLHGAGCRQYRMEIPYSRFERTLELPCDVSRAEVSTEYRDGMLLIHIEQREDRP